MAKILNMTNILPGSKPEKKLKYRNKPVKIDGITFQSGREGLRYRELKEQERIGLISALELQPRFDVKVNKKYICFYKADFRYNRKAILKGSRDFYEIIVEDVKSEATKKNSTYRLKKKLVEAIYGITILET